MISVVVGVILSECFIARKLLKGEYLNVLMQIFFVIVCNFVVNSVILGEPILLCGFMAVLVCYNVWLMILNGFDLWNSNLSIKQDISNKINKCE